MGLLDLFRGKITDQSCNNNLFQKEELQQLINGCNILANMFAESVALRATGNGRSEKMYQTMHSYKNIFVFFYDEICGYGKADQFLSSEEASRYALSHALVFSNHSTFKQCLSQLLSNWNDVMTVFKALTLSGEGRIIAKHESIIKQLTAAFVKLSNYNL